MIRRTTVALLAGLLLAACSAGGTASPAATSAPSANGEFELIVLQAEAPVEARVAIPGQLVSFLLPILVSFLLAINEEGPPSGAVEIRAAAEGARMTGIRPAALTAGVVGEVWVVPEQATKCCDRTRACSKRAGRQ